MSDAIESYGQKLARARARRDLLWNACLSWKEDDRIHDLVAFCTKLCGGDRKAGVSLASQAIWS
jgi:hypothetical protein